MQKSVTIIASALLLGYLVTELSVRFFADSYFALLVLCIAALAINGAFVTKVTGSQTGPSKRQPNDSRRGQGQGQRQGQGQGNTNSRNDKRRNETKSGGQNRRDRASADKPREEKNRNDPAQAEGPTSAPSGPTEEGEVKWFNRSKGYGFIIRPNADEIFVHQRSIVSDDRKARPVLRDGQKVKYVVVDSERGAQAEHVQPQD